MQYNVCCKTRQGDANVKSMVFGVERAASIPQGDCWPMMLDIWQVILFPDQEGAGKYRLGKEAALESPTEAPICVTAASIARI